MRVTRILLLAAVAVATLWAAPALAFHDGGVAHCDGCHTMHNSEDGVGVNDDGTGTGLPVGSGYTDLLLFPNATDVCTDCHGASGRSYAVWSANPTTITRWESAGDFVFLLEDNLNDGHRGSVASNWIPGEGGGHNVKSAIKGTDWDTTLSAPPAAPGLSPLTNNQLHCSSCHDPHGNDGFRLLYQAGQNVSIGDTVGPDVITYNTTLEAFGIGYGDDESNTLHNAYKAGYSEWCSTCHTGFHNAFGTNLIHPSGTFLTDEVRAAYNRYEGTTDCVNTPPSGGNPCGSGLSTDAYLAEVPFEDGTFTEFDRTRTAGPIATSKVVCVSCHRAHASSAANLGRWDFQVTLLIEDGDESGSWEIPNPYDDNQRSLCNKCHSQDEYDHLPTP